MTICHIQIESTPSIISSRSIGSVVDAQRMTKPLRRIEKMKSTLIRSQTGRMPFVPAGAVTGIGSLPFTSVVSGIGAVAELAATLEDARIRGAYAGLHCCAARPFERMLRVKPDILSFDADSGLELFFADSRALDFVRQGGTVAYGLVPTRSGLNAIDAASMYIRWLEAASRAGDPQQYAQSAMITATCGLGMLNTPAVAESFQVAHSISKLIRTSTSEIEQESLDHVD